MSFQNKSFWMPKEARGPSDGDTGYDSSSRLEPKRTHQWFMDASEPELFCNKKQAMEVANSGPMSGFRNVQFSVWENTSNFQSGVGKYSHRLSGSEPVPTFNLAGQNISSVGGSSDIERKGFEDQVGNNSSINLSMPQGTEDPSSYLGYGVRKVKVNQVSDSAKEVPVPMGCSYSRGDNNIISLGMNFSKSDNSISLGPTSNDGAGSIFNKAEGNIFSMGPFSMGDDNSILSMGRPFEKGNGNFFLMDQQYEKRDDNIISMDLAYNKGHENLFGVGITYNRANENFTSVGPTFGKGCDNIIPMGPTFNTCNDNVIPAGPTRDKVDASVVPMGTTHASIALVEPNADPNVSVAPAATSKTGRVRKDKGQKKPKKLPPNSFPSNVKSLLLTGMLDGVPVKYVSWSRDKSTRGVIKGTSYLCGCDDCKLSKALNAFDFERHAGCKTKHPNNHIYFENGKTIYAVVQELQTTPQEKLFEAMETVTGSLINKKNFSAWKASYKAANRELQRIYGNWKA